MLYIQLCLELFQTGIFKNFTVLFPNVDDFRIYNTSLVDSDVLDIYEGILPVFAHTCVACVAGKYKSASGVQACSNCSSGTYSTDIASTNVETCQNCLVYSHAPAGSGAQGDCACNTGSTGPGDGMCILCAVGKYKDTTGSAACASCDAGKYLGDLGGDAPGDCVACAAGYFQDFSAQSACDQCGTNTGDQGSDTGRTGCECVVGNGTRK